MGLGIRCESCTWKIGWINVCPSMRIRVHKRTAHLKCYAALPVNPHRMDDIMAEMEYRQLGKSGLKVPVLSYGTGTFGGGTEFFKAWGASDVAEATRLVDLCLDAGINLFDTADVYSQGLSEEILG